MNLRKTLLCGQCFRWQETAPGVFSGTAGGRFLTVSQKDLPLLKADPFWCSYFDLGTDYDTLQRQLAVLYPTLREAAQLGMGIHILRQDPWEALCSFILSQNNNIPRIQGIINRLCGGQEESLPPIMSGLRQQKSLHPFPSAETLAGQTEQDLAPLRCGFRARYLLDAAEKVASGTVNLEALRTAPLEEARRQLMTIIGVGPKVADCTLLYGLHRMEAFPKDVWIKRAMAQWFPGVAPSSFGPAAGLAQQYIFCWVRQQAGRTVSHK
ncbi:MAG: DNA glycosylase [Oscillospiraceae bacterium]|nr:DNA glycosylase [Caproicibacterium lactatifermentans]MDD4806889.1 DNA glycosylase [Oscillospiraceae bacterium]